MTNQEMMENYAKILVRRGLNIQPGEGLYIIIPLEGRELAVELQKYAYSVGASDVVIEWTDEELEELQYQHNDIQQSRDVYIKINDMQVDFANRGYRFLRLYSPSFLGKDVVLSEEAIAWRQEKQMLMSKVRALAGMGGMCIACCATKRWSQKLFPNMSDDEAIKKLWEYLFSVTRSDQENSLDKWKIHSSNIVKHCKILGELQLEKVRLVGEGTDLEIGLIPNHLFGGGEFPNNKGLPVVPNIPTEEIGTTPDYRRVNGIVKATKPLNYQGGIIEDFSIKFIDGVAVSWNADKGEDILSNIINTDEGSCRLGEFAVVPHDSPISNTGMVFLATLLDENASCHLALGNGFSFAVKDALAWDEDQRDRVGINNSSIHVDFMVGTATLNIYGYKDDQEIKIFENGAWLI